MADLIRNDCPKEFDGEEDYHCSSCHETGTADNGFCSFCGSDKIIPVDEVIDRTMAVMENR